MKGHPGFLSCVRTITLVVLIVGSGLISRAAARQTGGGGPPMPCCLGDGGPCCIGQWDPAPYNPTIACGTPGTPDCAGCSLDEIAHAALIPAGSFHLGVPPDDPVDIRGMVLLWTRCDNRAGYKTKIWDPSDPGGVAFEAPILEKINPPNEGLEDGPFCSGHVWILDEAHNPKLLTVGGQDRGDDNSATPEAYEDQDPNQPGIQNPCLGTGDGICALHKVYWFDPLAWGPTNAWSDDPQDLTDGRWYPTVTTQLSSDGTQFIASVLGGSPRAYTYGCGPFYQYARWWTSDDLAGPWAAHTDSYSDFGRSTQLAAYYWHYYPRPFQLSDGNLLTAGSAVMCEDDIPTNPYGGNPVSIITSGQFRVPGQSPNTNDTVLSPATPGGWNYCSGAILHTLNDLNYTESNPTSHYDLDRVLVTGGTREFYTGDLLHPEVFAQPYTHERVGAQWQAKANPLTPRAYANWVILPDGNLLLVGGADTQMQPNSTAYYSSVERFTPQSPTSLGYWTQMASRPNVVIGATTLPAPARGYHSVAMLLQDGRVAIMGGIRPTTLPWNNVDITPWSSVEIYRPGYCFESSRLRITSAQSADMQYGVPFFLTVNYPSRVERACLIGVSSVTHSFDYGQRYVDLMATPASGAGNLKVLAPPLKAMAPEGYYMLFVVENRNGVRIPSKGVFVKLR